MSRVRWWIPAILLAAVLAAAWFAVRWIRTPALAAYFTGPGQLMADARVGGQHGSFILDTGAARTIVTPALASRLQATVETVNTSGFLSCLEPVRAPVVRAGGIDFAAGERLRYPEKLVVIDLDRYSDPFRHAVHGILGWDVLKNYVMGFDAFDRQLLVGRRLDTMEVLRMLGMSRLAARLPLQTVDEHPTLTARVGDQQVRFLLDTGASWSILLRSTWKRLGRIPPTTGALFKSFPLQGEFSARKAHLGALTLGSLRLADLNVMIPENDCADEQISFDAVLGLEFLSHYITVIHGPEQVLYLGELQAPEQAEVPHAIVLSLAHNPADARRVLAGKNQLGLGGMAGLHLDEPVDLLAGAANLHRVRTGTQIGDAELSSCRADHAAAEKLQQGRDLKAGTVANPDLLVT
ncbi:MAG: retroviral-like aspartic protease family protein [Acidobacteriota bacterium]